MRPDADIKCPGQLGKVRAIPLPCCIPCERRLHPAQRDKRPEGVRVHEWFPARVDGAWQCEGQRL